MTKRRIVIAVGIIVVLLFVTLENFFWHKLDVQQFHSVNQRMPPPEETWERTGVGPFYFEQNILDLLNDTTASDTEVAASIYQLKTDYYMDTNRAEVYTWRTMALGNRQVKVENAQYMLKVIAEVPVRNNLRTAGGL